MENPIKMDDFGGTTIFGNTHMINTTKHQNCVLLHAKRNLIYMLFLSCHRWKLPNLVISVIMFFDSAITATIDSSYLQRIRTAKRRSAAAASTASCAACAPSKRCWALPRSSRISQLQQGFSVGAQVYSFQYLFKVVWLVLVGTRLSNHPLTQSAMLCTALVHTLHMPKPVIAFAFKVLRNALLRYILYTCPNLW